MGLIILVIGILIGLLIERYIFQEKPIGSLRVDHSDPDSGPYLLRVEIKNYISHK